MIPLKMQNLSRSEEYVELSGQTVDWLARMAGIEVRRVGLGDIVCCKPNPAIGGYTCYDESGRAVWNSAGTNAPVPKLCAPGGTAPAPTPPPAAPPPAVPPPMPRPTVPPVPSGGTPASSWGPAPSGLPPCCHPIPNPTNTGWWVACTVGEHGEQDGDPNSPFMRQFLQTACQSTGGVNTQTPGTVPTAPSSVPSLPQAPVPGLPPAGSPPPPPAAGTPPLPNQPFPAFPSFPTYPPVRKPPVYVPKMPRHGVSPSATVGVPVTLVEKLLRATEDAWQTAMRLVVTADTCDATDVQKIARDKALECLIAYKRSAGILRPAMDELCRAKREKRDARLNSVQVKALEDLALCVSKITAAAVNAAAKTGPDWLTTIVGTGLPAAGTALLTAL